MSQNKSPSVAGLILIYAVLLGLLVLTVVMAALPLGSLGLLVALAIASAKGILVILYFMHLRFSSRVTWLFAAAGFVWLGLLFSLTFTEYIGRSHLSRMQAMGELQPREDSPDHH